MKFQRTIYIITILMTACNIAYSQGQIIDRETRSGKSFSVKIIEVKNDSITYNYLGKTKTIPLSDIIAYHLNTDVGYFTFPDPKDKERYLIVKNKAIDKNEIEHKVEAKEKGDYMLEMLKKHELSKQISERKTLRHKILLYTKYSSKFVSANPKRQVYITLKSDPKNVKLHGKFFKITNDSIAYMRFRLKKKTHYYAINKNDIKNLSLETQKDFNKRMLVGIPLCVLVPCYPFTYIPLYILNHPVIKQFDMENEWVLQLNNNRIK